MNAIAAWPLWDLATRDQVILVALLIVVLQHGGTAGIHAAMGRDGRLNHRPAEALGALRGTLALAPLLGPLLVIWSFDALSSPARMAVYAEANRAILAVYLPVTVIALLSFMAARVTPWQVRSNLNSVVLGTLELLRPWIALAGMLAGVWVTRDWGVAILGALALAAGLAVGPLTRRWWYSRPVRLADLGVDDLPAAPRHVG